MNNGVKIANAAKTWLGTPYESNAMIKGVGVDCAHLLVGAVIDAGLIQAEDVVIEQYSNEWHLHRSEEKFLHRVMQYADKVEGPLQVGDFMLYQYGRCISHGAIYIGNDMVIHAYVGQGVILSSIRDVMFYDHAHASRFRGAWRYNAMKVRRGA